MAGVPNEEKPASPVPDSYVPPLGVRHPVKNGETWIIIAKPLSLHPWDLIDFNFPGTKRALLTNVERGTRQVNWYLREYVGCQKSLDGQNWAFESGLTKGKGGWRGGFIYTPPAKQPPVPITQRRCSPTSAGTFGRRPTFYRLLTDAEKALARRVFGPTMPPLDLIGIGDGLGKDGSAWTDMVPMTDPVAGYMGFQINMGDARSTDLTSKQDLATCFVSGIRGTVSDLFIHEMTHVWQYHNRPGITARFSVWVSSLGGDYNFTPGDSWDSYDVEQQASIVEKWYHDGEGRNHVLYPYVRLVVRGASAGEDALRYASGLTLNELNRDLADLKARKLD